jgi:hypothetical protein
LISLLALVLPLALFLSAVVMFPPPSPGDSTKRKDTLECWFYCHCCPDLTSTQYPLSNREGWTPIPIVGQYALAANALGGKQS